MPDAGWDAALTWLRERIDADERTAGCAGADQPAWTYDRETFTVSSGSYAIAARKDRLGTPMNDVDGTHIANNDPAAVLRRVESDRRILTIYDTARDSADHDAESEARFYLMADVVKAFAQRYAHLPDFPEVLRPDRERDG